MGIDEQRARTIAGDWHGGQGSALYSLSSAGGRRVEALHEVQRELRTLDERADPSEADALRGELQALADYLKPDEWRQQARELGEDAGRAAGSWAADGNTPSDAAIRLLIGLSDGDPAAWDSLPPAPTLAGAELTIAGLALQIVGEAIEGMPNKRELTSEIVEAWEQGVTATFADACMNALDGAVQWIETEYGDALFAKDGIEVRATREQTQRWASAQRSPHPALAGRALAARWIGSLTEAAERLPCDELTVWSKDVLSAAARKIGL